MMYGILFWLIIAWGVIIEQAFSAGAMTNNYWWWMIPPGVAIVCVTLAFTMRDVSPFWLFSVFGISNFHELNVRTYVHHKGKKPGVWFFSLDAASRLAVWGARRLYRLPYHEARIQASVEADAPAGAVRRSGGRSR